MKLTIDGQSATKKNSQRLVGSGKRCGSCGKQTGRPFLLPSAAYKAWEADAIRQVRAQLPVGHRALDIRVTMSVQVYRGDARSSDMLNHLAAVSDLIEAAGVLEDDRLVSSTDGSRLRIDRERPRVEITIEPFTEEIDTAPLSKRRVRPRATQAALPLAAPPDDVPIS